MAGSLSSAYEAPHLNQDRAHEPSDQATVCEPAAYRFSSSAEDISDDASYGSLQPAIEQLALAVAACGLTRVVSHLHDGGAVARSEARRVGKEGVSTGISGWGPDH